MLARYGVRQVCDGRKVGGHLNVKDVSSPYCQRLKGVILERLDRFDEEDQAWEEILIEDRTAGPADIACTRIDFDAWMRSLPRRDRKIAEYLSAGHRTRDAAKRFKISQGRVSQLRRELAQNWRRFVGDEPGPAAANAV